MSKLQSRTAEERGKAASLKAVEVAMALANEPSTGLCYIQQHVQQSTPVILSLQAKLDQVSSEAVFAQEQAVELSAVVREMTSNCAASCDRINTTLDDSFLLLQSLPPPSSHSTLFSSTGASLSRFLRLPQPNTASQHPSPTLSSARTSAAKGADAAASSSTGNFSDTWGCNDGLHQDMPGAEDEMAPAGSDQAPAKAKGTADREPAEAARSAIAAAADSGLQVVRHTGADFTDAAAPERSAGRDANPTRGSKEDRGLRGQGELARASNGGNGAAREENERQAFIAESKAEFAKLSLAQEERLKSWLEEEDP